MSTAFERQEAAAQRVCVERCAVSASTLLHPANPRVQHPANRADKFPAWPGFAVYITWCGRPDTASAL